MARITSDRYPYLMVRCTVGGQQREGWALVDTGFDGDFALPLAEIAHLGVPDHPVELEQADGSVVEAPCYVGTVEIVGIASYRAEIVLLGDQQTIGRGIVDHLRVTFDHGQRLTVDS